MNQPLLARTIELLNASDLGTREIAERSGVTYEWLKKLRAGAPHDFGVSRVQAVHDFLAGLEASSSSSSSEAAA